MRNLKARAEDAFSEKNEDQAVQYLDWLRSALFDLAGSVRRSAILALFLVAVFEFLEESHGAAFTLGGFRINEGSIVLPLIPALVAYLYIEIIISSAKVRVRQNLFTEVFKRWSPQAEQNDLDMYVMPTNYLFWNPGRGLPRAENRSSIERTENRVSMVFAVTVLVGIFLFEGQAYYILLNGNSISFYVLYGLSLLMTIFCLSMVVAYWWFEGLKSA